MSELSTASDLAEMLRISEDQVKRKTKADNWPHIRFGTKTIRYKAEHVEAILALYERADAPVAAEPINGQTARSHRRSA